MLSIGPKALPGCCRQRFTAVYFSVAVRYLPLPGGIFSAFFPADRPLPGAFFFWQRAAGFAICLFFQIIQKSSPQTEG